MSALKSSPLSASSINIAFASSNLKLVTSDMVTSVLVLSSTSFPVSALSDAIIFSPTWNAPETFTRLRTASVIVLSVSLVSVLKINPVALDVAPFT